MKIIKFGAVWCPKCMIFRPHWEEIEKQFPDLNLEYFDFDKDKETAIKYNIEDLPTFILLDQEGKEIARFFGIIRKEALVKAILENKDK